MGPPTHQKAGKTAAKGFGVGQSEVVVNDDMRENMGKSNSHRQGEITASGNEGLLYNESDLDPVEHYTDTHGYTEINFAA